MSWDAIKIDFNKINTWRFAAILFAVVAIFAMRECHVSEVKIGSNYIKLDQYEKEKMSFTRTINKQGEEITKQKEVLIDKDKIIEDKILENSQLAELNSQIKIQTKANKSNFTASYELPEGKEENIFYHDTIVKYIKVGTKFSHNEKWFSIAGNIGKKGIEFDSIEFRNRLQLTLGYEKRKGIKSIFKEKPLVIEGINSNPYMTTTGMQNISFKKPKKKWYETRAFAFGVGVIAGAIINK